jgi:hypothetical protein
MVRTVGLVEKNTLIRGKIAISVYRVELEEIIGA